MLQNYYFFIFFFFEGIFNIKITNNKSEIKLKIRLKIE